MSQAFYSYSHGCRNSIIVIFYWLLYNWLLSLFLNRFNQMIILRNLLETWINKMFSALRAFNPRLIVSVHVGHTAPAEGVPTPQDHRLLRLIMAEVFAADGAN